MRFSEIKIPFVLKTCLRDMTLFRKMNTNRAGIYCTSTNYGIFRSLNKRSGHLQAE